MTKLRHGPCSSSRCTKELILHMITLMAALTPPHPLHRPVSFFSHYSYQNEHHYLTMGPKWSLLRSRREEERLQRLPRKVTKSRDNSVIPAAGASRVCPSARLPVCLSARLHIIKTRVKGRFRVVTLDELCFLLTRTSDPAVRRLCGEMGSRWPNAIGAIWRKIKKKKNCRRMISV